MSGPGRSPLLSSHEPLGKAASWALTLCFLFSMEEAWGQRIVRVFHDYGAPWPLWESCDKYSMDPEDYDLSEQLTALMRRSGELFDHFHPEDGWPSDHLRDQYAMVMQEVVQRLRTELWGKAAVQDEHDWPLT